MCTFCRIKIAFYITHLSSQPRLTLGFESSIIITGPATVPKAWLWIDATALGTCGCSRRMLPAHAACASFSADRPPVISFMWIIPNCWLRNLINVNVTVYLYLVVMWLCVQSLASLLACLSAGLFSTPTLRITCSQRLAVFRIGSARNGVWLCGLQRLVPVCVIGHLQQPHVLLAPSATKEGSGFSLEETGCMLLTPPKKKKR